MKINNCIECGNNAITMRDCGYSCFNPGHATCTKCGKEVSVQDCDYLNPEKYLKKAWNCANPKPLELLKKIDRKIKDLQEEKRRIKKLFKKELI